MSNCLFGFPDYTQATPLYTPVASIGNGSWVSTLPVSNVLDRRLSRVARTTTLTNAQINFDLGVARSVGLLSVLLPNLTVSSSPTFAFGLDSTPGTGGLYYSGSLQARPTGITVEDLTGPDGSPLNVWNVAMPTSPITARYGFLVVTDTGNADGYIDVARVIIAGAFKPTNVDMSDGAKHQQKNDTVRTVTDGSSALYNVKRTYRTDGFSIEDFVDADASIVRKMNQRLGTSGQFFWIPDATDTTYGWQRNYLATMEQLTALTANQGRSNGEFSVLEVL
ncbi:MAG TPA: hypothetical protein VGM50_23025 [Gemmatimonadaceae bacterium]|jgi:hypothetical protein